MFLVKFRSYLWVGACLGGWWWVGGFDEYKYRSEPINKYRVLRSCHGEPLTKVRGLHTAPTQVSDIQLVNQSVNQSMG